MADGAAPLPQWQATANIMPKNNFFLLIFFICKADTRLYNQGITQEKDTMLHDFEEVNSILAELAADGTLEPMAEPCDCDNVHPLDWAEAVGLFEEVAEYIYPEA